MQVPSLGWEDPLKEDMATHSSIFTWKIRGAWWATGHRVAKSQTWLKWLSTHVHLVDGVLLINNVMIISGESKRTQPYIFIHPFSPNIPSYPYCHRIHFCVCFFVYKCYLSLQNSRFTKKVPIIPKIPIWKFYDKQEELCWNHKKTTGEGNGNSLQYSCLEYPMDRGAWQAGLVTKPPPPPYENHIALNTYWQGLEVNIC